MNGYMKRAIELAKLGTGFTNPNPLVGAVIVKDGRVIGEGYHERYGGPHAERNAISHCTEDTRGADIYVTLEPCCHRGKQPPCTEALIEAGIRRVYIGSDDPNPLVSGKSEGILRSHGIEVVKGVMKKECDSLNDIFFYYITHGMPYVIMKAAASLDGRIAARTGDSKWITNEQSRAHAHGTRKRCAAIMVGINTVLADDPMLNCRCAEPSDPVRVICDSRLRIPLGSNIMKTARDIPTVIAASEQAPPEKAERIKAAGAEIIFTDGERVDMRALMAELGRRGIDSVLAEGGASLHASLLKAGLVNKLHLYIAPKIIGGDGRPAVGAMGIDRVSEAVSFGAPAATALGGDMLLEYTAVKGDG